MLITRIFGGLTAVVLASSSLALTTGPVAALTIRAAGGGDPQTGPPIPVTAPSNASDAAKSYTSEFTTNWSGYAQKVGTATGPYTAVRDYWTVPTVDTGLPGDQYSADWVGIGERGTLVQAGTEADNIGGRAHYYAWTEMIPAQLNQKISDLNIDPGDQMEGLVEETSKNVWKMAVYDLTTGKADVETATANASDGGPMSQTSAEAIHERTRIHGRLPTLAQTTNVTFDPGVYSTAKYTPKWKPLLIAAPGATVNQIFMENKKGGLTIASPSVPSADKEGFTVAFGTAGPSAPWGTAEEIPGLATLSPSGSAQVTSISCTSVGDCNAGGYYTDMSNAQQAFVASEADGSWGAAQEVPGTAALNQAGNATITSVSCAAAGNCSAGGYYVNGSGDYQALVVSEADGSWGTAEEVPGLAALDQGEYAQVTSVSCGAAGNCSAGGYYDNSSRDGLAFVVSEADGSWGTAEEVPGLAALDQGEYAQVTSVSCGAAGNCSAGGAYDSSSNQQQAFVVSETDGSWGTAQEVPGTAALNQGGIADISSVSCATAGNCSAGGFYIDSTAKQQAFVVSESGGQWGAAQQVPGTAALNQNGGAQVFSVSCNSTGNCGAGGVYDGSNDGQAFVVSEVDGSWGTAQEVPGLAALDLGGIAGITSVSCGAAGNCSAGGQYGSVGNTQAFVVSETDGTWGTVQEVPGTGVLNQGGDATITSLSCAAAGSCSAGGYYAPSSGGFQAFVAGEPST
jgi:hypothetical protein